MDTVSKRHSVKEIIGKLERAEDLVSGGASMADAAAAIGVTDARFSRWRKQYSGLHFNQLSYIKELEAEVARLRKAIREFDGNSLRANPPAMRRQA
ncbi:MAG: transposase [Terricaulis sp.]